MMPMEPPPRYSGLPCAVLVQVVQDQGRAVALLDDVFELEQQLADALVLVAVHSLAKKGHERIDHEQLGPVLADFGPNDSQVFR